jgi:hypothetical protein
MHALTIPRHQSHPLRAAVGGTIGPSTYSVSFIIHQPASNLEEQHPSRGHGARYISNGNLKTEGKTYY